MCRFRPPLFSPILSAGTLSNQIFISFFLSTSLSLSDCVSLCPSVSPQCRRTDVILFKLIYFDSLTKFGANMEHMSQFNSTVFDFRYRFEFQMMTRLRVISYEDRRDLRRFLSPKDARCCPSFGDILRKAAYLLWLSL